MNKRYNDNLTKLDKYKQKVKKKKLERDLKLREQTGRREREEEEEEEKRKKLEGKQKGVERNKFKGKIMYKYIMF